MKTSRTLICRLLAISTGLALCFALGATAHAQGKKDGFDREYRSVYNEWLFDAKTAYDGKRYDQALPLMQKAACAGDKESQWLLGQMYLRGQGVERDDLHGYAWVKAASEFQSAEYRNTAKTLEEGIDAQHKDEAKALAAKLIDQYGTRATNISCSLASSTKGYIKDRIACVPRYQGKMVLLKRCVDAPAAAK